MPTRKRIKSFRGTITGTGGGTPTPGLALWGPEFGNPPESGVAVLASIGPLELIHNKVVGVHASMGQLEINALSAGVGITALLSRYDITEYLDWANANVLTTNITNPANAIDKDTGSFAHAQAASTASPTWLTNVTTNFTLESSFPDFASPFTDFTIDSVFWEYAFESIHTSAGVVVTPATANVNIDRSVNDGGAWTTQENVVSIATGLLTRSIDLTATIGGDWTKVSQFRSRQTGSITSGTQTATQSIQQFRVHYSRLKIVAHKDNP